MNPKLFVLFNHQITADQQTDARSSLAVSAFVEPPQSIRSLWKNVPPDLPAIEDYLTPVKAWLAEMAAPGDYLLVQGDFGATYTIVRFAFERGLIPVYATTERRVEEDQHVGGTVTATHSFRHRRFRKYGE
jgi:hypothetical protein